MKKYILDLNVKEVSRISPKHVLLRLTRICCQDSLLRFG